MELYTTINQCTIMIGRGVADRASHGPEPADQQQAPSGKRASGFTTATRAGAPPFTATTGLFECFICFK